ncbi:hypothetical protein [Armatimonas sp.]|uniref:hypothetical protein n=1 Tax=Armatimonas sp. TaxID=1872638 RepID=UPI003750F2DE
MMIFQFAIGIFTSDDNKDGTETSRCITNIKILLAGFSVFLAFFRGLFENFLIIILTLMFIIAVMCTMGGIDFNAWNFFQVKSLTLMRGLIVPTLTITFVLFIVKFVPIIGDIIESSVSARIFAIGWLLFNAMVTFPMSDSGLDIKSIMPGWIENIGYLFFSMATPWILILLISVIPSLVFRKTRE